MKKKKLQKKLVEILVNLTFREVIEGKSERKAVWANGWRNKYHLKKKKKNK